MNELNPSQIFGLSQYAYLAKSSPENLLKDQIGRELPFINKDSFKVITATSGLFSPVLSGFGFMAQLNGGRSTEIVIATRGTLTASDWGTTFKSYVQQLNAFIKQQNLGFKPTAVHCMGHSLGGALANLNAAAYAAFFSNTCP